MRKNWVENTKCLIERHGLEARLLEHKEWGKDSRVVSETLGIPLTNVLKALVCFSEEEPIIALICGDDRLDLKKLGALLRTSVRLGKAREVEILGFTVGGVPAIGSGLKAFVDRKVLEKDFVVGSAGSPYVGIELKPKDLVCLNKAIVADLVEKGKR